MVICLGQGADLHMAQLMPLPLTVFCFSKIRILFLVPAHVGNPMCVCITHVISELIMISIGIVIVSVSTS